MGSSDEVFISCFKEEGKNTQKWSKDHPDYLVQAVISIPAKRFSILLADLSALLMDVLAESRSTSEKTHFVSFSTLLQRHHGASCPVFAFSRHYIPDLSSHLLSTQKK